MDRVGRRAARVRGAVPADESCTGGTGGLCRRLAPSEASPTLPCGSRGARMFSDRLQRPLFRRSVARSISRPRVVEMARLASSGGRRVAVQPGTRPLRLFTRVLVLRRRSGCSMAEGWRWPAARARHRRGSRRPPACSMVGVVGRSHVRAADVGGPDTRPRARPLPRVDTDRSASSRPSRVRRNRPLFGRRSCDRCLSRRRVVERHARGHRRLAATALVLERQPTGERSPRPRHGATHAGCAALAINRRLVRPP